MKRPSRTLSVSLAGAACALAVAAVATSAPAPGPATFEVTVTNLTSGQVFAPLVVATHDTTVDLFEPGQPASSELALLAEEGDGSQLMALLGGAGGVHAVVGGAGMILPGESETVTIDADGGARALSLAAMLVSTNDVFAGLDAVALPAGGSVTVYALGWDAGSEFDSEACAFVPGPPCGSGGAHDPTAAEGFVHVSGGIHGIGDLKPELVDWRGPVARVVVTRVN